VVFVIVRQVVTASQLESGCDSLKCKTVVVSYYCYIGCVCVSCLKWKLVVVLVIVEIVAVCHVEAGRGVL
jgi:hypothetical protein